MNTILNYMTDLNYAQTATLIHVASLALKERISFAEAYEAVGTFIHPIHGDGDSINAEIEDIQEPRKLVVLITISALRLENMLKGQQQ